MTASVLDVRGLAKSFNGSIVLDNIDLHLEQGSTTAVVGSSGCGKTTLLRVVAGFEAPDAGTVRSQAGRSQARKALWRRIVGASATSPRTGRCSHT